MKRLAILLVIFILAGCWDSQEINEFSYVLGIGIDETEDGSLQLTFQIADLKQEGGTKNISADGRTFAAAQQNLGAVSGKDINLEHTRVIVIGESLARQDISEFVQSAFRDMQIRCSTPVVVARGTAADLLEIDTALFTNLTSNNEPVLTDSNVLDIAGNLWQHRDYLAQLVGRDGEEFKILGGAIFHENKMIAEVPIENIANYKILTQGLKRFGIDLEMEGHISVDAAVIDVEAKIYPIIADGNPSIKIDITGEYSIVEKGYTTSEMNDKLAYQEKINKAINDDLTQKCRDVTELSKESGADFLRFGQKFKNQHTAWWDEKSTQWQEILPNVPIDITVDLVRI